MKKLLFILFITLGFSLSAQNKFKSGFNIGFVASQVQGDGYAGFNKLGITGGIFSRFILNDKSNIQFEINYIQKGSNKVPNFEQGDYDKYRFSLQYVEVPLLYRFRYKKYIGEVGPTFSYLIKGTEEGTAGVFTSGAPYKEFEIGGIIGGSYQITQKFFASARSGFSLTPIRNNPGQIASIWNMGQTHILMTFTMGYIFG